VLTGIALGGGVFDQQQPWISQWQHKLFAGFCHQQPSRSFWIGGQPMAVCSRCFGIYSGFALAWISIPFVTKALRRFQYLPKVLFVTLLLNFVDIVGNVLGFWQNTVLSRFITGLLLGIAAAWLLGRAFVKQYQLNQSKNIYGTDRIV